VLILASGSPRRSELLAGAGILFRSVPADIAEVARLGESPRELVERLAREKAEFVLERMPSDPRPVVLGSDTVVVLDGHVLGKPSGTQHAVSMLRRLVGRAHQVLTGVAVLEGGREDARVLSVSSRVFMRPAEESELRAYARSGEPLDKAGAYALQGEGRRFVTHVEGSESNVIGLPLEETLALLRAAGVEPVE
jgi:septum formation protein